jgi:hypothetical protein
VPHILLSVRKIERLSVVTGPIGIMGIVAIFFPREILAEDLLSKRDRDQLGSATCLIFASGDIWLGHRDERSEAPPAKRRDVTDPGKATEISSSEKVDDWGEDDPYE